MNGAATTGRPAARPPMRGLNPLYPCSDGKPMAESELQRQWIVAIEGNLDALFRGRDDVVVAADNLVYPVEGDPTVCTAPDVYVALGRPAGDRASYIVHEEGGVFPQVVFEVRSPSNRAGEMARKPLFYEQHGAEEYYDFDPQRNRLRVYVRTEGQLDEVPDVAGWESPLLGIRFDTSGPELVVRYPDGRPFLTFQETVDRADQAERENARLRALLRAAGLDPDAPAP